MAQLQDDLWIEGPFHVDFSPRGELRIVGRGNHLYLGLAGLKRRDVEIDRVGQRAGRLHIRGRFTAKKLDLLDPVVRSVRRVRELTEAGERPDFAELIRSRYEQVGPDEVSFELRRGRPTIIYRRSYGDQWYGARIAFAKEVTVTRVSEEPVFRLETGAASIEWQIMAEASFPRAPRERRVVKREVIDLGRFRDRADFIRHLLDRTALEITHLVNHDKTSGFEYGTIFPRDWMESADLGVGDLSSTAIDYMYERALQFVSPEGLGWHENLIGEAQFETEQLRGALLETIRGMKSEKVSPRTVDVVTERKELLVSRQMIDIEPRYLMGMDRVSPKFWRKKENALKLRRVAKFVLKEAREKELIAFREKPSEERRHRDDIWHDVGNWRDSPEAFAHAPLPVAPFDVNVAFYPAALRALGRHAKRLGVEAPDLSALITKWEGVETRFRFRNSDGRGAYALALVGAGSGEAHPERLAVNHTDEAYALIFGSPERTVVRSFAERLLDSNYFYTASGPTVVGLSEPGYSSLDYHGKVIWTKQTALCSQGISLSLERAKREKWEARDIKLLTEALQAIFGTSLRAFAELGGIPELHYDRRGKAHFYDDQREARGQMSKVQLWSAVGARRILRDYHALMGQV